VELFVKGFKLGVVEDDALVMVVFIASGVGNGLKVDLAFGVKLLESFSCLVFGGSVVLYSDGI
jgi:hypothetical protein